MFDTFGLLAPDVVVLLRRVQRVMHSNIMYSRFMNVVFMKIGFVIQKGLTHNLLLVCFSLMCKFLYIYTLPSLI